MKKLIFTLSLLLICLSSAYAKVTLPPVLADNMVLQQQTEATLWGKAKPEAKVVITTTWSKDKTVVNADADGKWIAKVQTPLAGGPYEITFNDGEKLTLKNVLIGEVWICSGQSNMEMPMKGFNAQPVQGATELILAAQPSTLIRSCNVEKVKSFDLQEECPAKWYENTPEGVAEASAVAYFFAKQLYDALHIPIGIIHASWGGTPIEAWMSKELLETEFAGEFDLSRYETREWPEKNPNPYQYPGVLYNGMLYSLKNYTVKGFIWYQGCSNRHNPEQYKRLQPAFVKMLRKDWDNEDMPFYFTQIAPYKHNTPEMMWAQAQTVAMIPHSGMASAHDVGEYHVIHPARKKPIGDRLAYLALQNDYGFKYLDANTPVPTSVEFKEGEAIVKFNVDEMGLNPRSQDLKGFEMAGEDGAFYPAVATLHGRGAKAIKVYKCPQVTNPVAVRYAWKRWSPPTMFNGSGVPMTPFYLTKE